MLYLRSRQVPASLAAVAAGAAVWWMLCRYGEEGPVDPRLTALLVAVGATAGSVGLGGQDAALDRTAAIRWAPRRVLHVLLVAAVAAGALLAVQAAAGDGAAAEFLARDSAGLTGLAAGGAVLFGARNAWTLPFSWLAVTLFVPPPQGLRMQVATWMLLPPDTAAGTWTALTLAFAGTAAYAFAGPRR